MSKSRNFNGLRLWLVVKQWLEDGYNEGQAKAKKIMATAAWQRCLEDLKLLFGLQAFESFIESTESETVKARKRKHYAQFYAVLCVESFGFPADMASYALREIGKQWKPIPSNDREKAIKVLTETENATRIDRAKKIFIKGGGDVADWDKQIVEHQETAAAWDAIIQGFSKSEELPELMYRLRVTTFFLRTATRGIPREDRVLYSIEGDGLFIAEDTPIKAFGTVRRHCDWWRQINQSNLPNLSLAGRPEQNEDDDILKMATKRDNKEISGEEFWKFIYKRKEKKLGRNYPLTTEEKKHEYDRVYRLLKRKIKNRYD